MANKLISITTRGVLCYIFSTTFATLWKGRSADLPFAVSFSSIFPVANTDPAPCLGSALFFSPSFSLVRSFPSPHTSHLQPTSVPHHRPLAATGLYRWRRCWLHIPDLILHSLPTLPTPGGTFLPFHTGLALPTYFPRPYNPLSYLRPYRLAHNESLSLYGRPITSSHFTAKHC